MKSASKMAVIRFSLSEDANGSLSISQLDNFPLVFNASDTTEATAYDDKGALYYVIAVIFIYGFSIVLMIGSTVKRKDHDDGVHNYLNGLEKIRMLEWRQEKFKIRQLILGSDKAKVVVVPPKPAKSSRKLSFEYSVQSNRTVMSELSGCSECSDIYLQILHTLIDHYKQNVMHFVIFS